MDNMIKPILASYRFSNFIMNLVLTDLTNEQATTRSRKGEGSSISWIVGHLLDFRCQAINLFGIEREREFKEMFRYASDGSDYPDIKELKEEWDKLHNEIEAAFANITDDQITAPIKSENSVHEEKTVLDVITFFMWHESYHIGVIGAIRKELGLKSTSDKATEASHK